MFIPPNQQHGTQESSELAFPIARHLRAFRLRTLILLLGGSVFALLFMLSPARAQGQCSRWDVGFEWKLQQSNGPILHIVLAQDGDAFRGIANYRASNNANQRGSVTGTMNGRAFNARIAWQNGSRGLYFGTVGSDGRLHGYTDDRDHSAKRANWSSDVKMNCSGVTIKAPEPLATPPPSRPVKIVGKRSPTSTTPPVEGGAPPAPAQRAPVMSASSQLVNIPAGQTQGSTTISWDGGNDHPYAEVWVEVDGDSKFVVEQGKGSRQVTVERGKTYRYILTDSGQQLATVTIRTSAAR